MSEIEIAIPFPLDADGFLRRECSLCLRQFKWLPSETATRSEEPAEYACPYCSARAGSDDWFTAEQMQYIHDEVLEQAVRPQLTDFGQSLANLQRRSRGLVNATLQVSDRERAPLVFEPNDMRRVDFPCHPDEPIKVLDAWEARVRCLICGESNDATVQ